MPDTHDLLCAVCSGRADKVAFLHRNSIEAVACSNLACVSILMRAIRSPPDPYHAEALAAGGKAGGAKLTEFGQTDLKYLSREQYAEFIFEIVAGWRAALAMSAEKEALAF